MSNLPRHIAIVMDGNGRWAKRRGLPRVAGHKAGAKAVRIAIEYAARQKIEALTLFALSVENKNLRPVTEVSYLMKLFLESLQKNTKELHKNNIKIQIIGDRNQFESKLLKYIEEAEVLTASNTGLILTIAINYSGRWDIVQAAKQVAQQAMLDQVHVADIDEAMVQSQLCLADLPEPDLFIRTSGEKRISNFMLWQTAYTELYFTDVYWPDFNEAAFADALSAYQQRQRRFGLTGEQLEITSA